MSPSLSGGGGPFDRREPGVSRALAQRRVLGGVVDLVGPGAQGVVQIGERLHRQAPRDLAACETRAQ
ncbi:MAG TPA: hypothetical protein VGJ60_33075 [Chloroflexota bacterium]|jgi:hypothetical protein